jgi:phosphatidylglycerol---prolipoprotein diacylglyceryl transferase
MILLRCYPRLSDWIADLIGHPIALRLPIYSYGFMMACGFLAAAYAVTREMKRREALGAIPDLGEKDGLKKWASDLVGDWVFICALFGVAGSSFFNFLENPTSYDNFWQDPAGTLFSGLSVFGGMICAGLALLVYNKVKKIHIPHSFDCIAYSFVLALGIGRLGCHVSGDGDWGIPNTQPKPAYLPQIVWANNYEHNIANDGVYMQGCTEEHCMVLPQPVYPTSIYEFLECTAIFLILHGLRRRWTTRPGLLFLACWFMLGIQRYTIEQIRSISDRQLYHLAGHGFKQAELISIALVIIGAVGFWLLNNYYKRQEQLAVSHP